MGRLAALHFLVDALCLCCLYLLAERAGGMSLTHVFILYNVMAFLTQPLTGWLADVLLSRSGWVWVSVGLLATAVLTSTVMMLTASFTLPLFFVVALLLGAGNSLFHVWGGKLVAVATNNDMRALGVFVSTGAFGLAVATVCYSWPLLYVLLAAVGIMTKTQQTLPLQTLPLQTHPRPLPEGRGVDSSAISPTNDKSIYSPPSQGGAGGGSSSPVREGLGVGLLFALILFVMLRSHVGGVFSSCLAGQGGASIVLLIGATAMAGKMAGGWIARQTGIVWGLTLMVAATVVCLLLRDAGFAWQLSGLLTINFTMPVTLYMANAVLPGREGLAFGLLAAALMPAYLL